MCDRRKLFLALSPILLCLPSWACRQPAEQIGAVSEIDAGPVQARRHVVLILLDAARADRFSCYGYSKPTTPEMDRLSSDGIVFLSHFAQATGTRESTPSMLFSRYFTPPLFPNDPRVPYASPNELFRKPDAEQVSLPKAFESAGFVTAAISAHLWMGEKTAFAGEFQELRDLTKLHHSEKYPYPRAREVVDDAIGWISRNREFDFFLYVHMMDTHFPHYFEEDAREFFGSDAYGATRFNAGGAQLTAELTSRDLDYADALYDGSLRYADRHLGRLFAYLRETGLLEHATIAITADHGEYLRDGRGGHQRVGKVIFSHGGEGFDPVMRIPLILHSPRSVDQDRYQGLSEGVDVAPTLLRLAGVDLPEGKRFDGVDLVALVAGQTPEKQQVVMRQTVRTVTHKAIFASRDRVLLGETEPKVGSLRGRLYDLVADPLEVDDVFDDQPETVGRLVRCYREVLREPYLRAQSARSSDQPGAAFAISADFVRTDPRLVRVRGQEVPTGWSLIPGEPHSALTAVRTDEPLEVRFPLPNGDYQLSLGLTGGVVVEISGRATEVVSDTKVASYGFVTVTDETFRARITPRGDVRVFFFGFIPVGVAGDDAERLEKLRALGYVQ